VRIYTVTGKYFEETILGERRGEGKTLSLAGNHM